MPAPTEFTAIVCGSTGAVGRALVAQLAALPGCAAVVALARRELGLEAAFPELAPADFRKVVLVNIGDHARLGDPAIGQLFRGVTLAFCCLGASRFDAKTARAIENAEEGPGGGAVFEAALRAVDHEYMMAFGRQAETAGVAHFQLVSAMGVDAEADRYGGAMGPYGLVKGAADNDAMNSLRFPNGITVIRPGLLARGELAKTRPNELAAHAKGHMGTPVQVVARAMIAEATQRLAAVVGARPISRVMLLPEIERTGAAGAPAPAAKL